MDRNEPAAAGGDAGRDIERPIGDTPSALFGSDPIAETLRDLGIPWIALNPGASFRGLHDSLVNHLGNIDPQINAIGTAVFVVSITLVVIAQMLIMGRSPKPESA